MTLEDQVRGAVARGWCYPETSHKVMDNELVEAIVKEVVKAFEPVADKARRYEQLSD